MTREELIKELDGIVPKKPKSDWSIYQRKIVEMAIKTLEQEIVSKESYDHEYFLRKEFELKIDKLEQQKHILDKVRDQLKSNLRGVEIALEVLVENDPLRPKMEGAKTTLEDCLELIDKVESEK